MYRYTVYLFRNFALTMLPERPRGRGGICSALRACVNVTVQTTVTRQTRQPVPRAKGEEMVVVARPAVAMVKKMAEVVKAVTMVLARVKVMALEMAAKMMAMMR